MGIRLRLQFGLWCSSRYWPTVVEFTTSVLGATWVLWISSPVRHLPPHFMHAEAYPSPAFSDFLNSSRGLGLQHFEQLLTIFP